MTPHPRILEAAAQVLTEKQFAAWLLSTQGHGTRAISAALDLSRAAVLDRLAGAGLNLRKAGIYQDASGRWIMDASVRAQDGSCGAETPNPSYDMGSPVETVETLTRKDGTCR